MICILLDIHLKVLMLLTSAPLKKMKKRQKVQATIQFLVLFLTTKNLAQDPRLFNPQSQHNNNNNIAAAATITSQRQQQQQHRSRNISSAGGNHNINSVAATSSSLVAPSSTTSSPSSNIITQQQQASRHPTIFLPLHKILCTAPSPLCMYSVRRVISTINTSSCTLFDLYISYICN
jgi:hypothetical protein